MSKAHLNQVIASHFVEIKADESPDKPIFIFEKGNNGEDLITFKDLHVNANKIARWFIDNDIGKGDYFAIYMRNHPEFIYALLGGIVVGAIAVPIDPRYRGERLKFIINNSSAKAVSARGNALPILKRQLMNYPPLKRSRWFTIPSRGSTLPPNTKL